MLCGSYRFHGVLPDDAVLPENKDVLFQSALGPALRHVVCAMKQKDCAGCILDRRCLYPLLFSSPPPANHHLLPPFPKGKIRSAATPPPCVVEPPETRQTSFKRGDAFDFGLILFGRSNEHLAHFIQAFEEMGRIGIGRRTERGRSRFALASVESHGRAIWDGRDRRLDEDEHAEDLKAALLGDLGTFKAAPAGGLTVQLETPLAGVTGGRRAETLPFPVLMRAALRRVLMLCRTYGKGRLDIDSQDVLQRAVAVRTAGSDLRWIDPGRPSRRGEPEAPAGGLAGSVSYEGDLGAFMPFLRFCEQVHLGEQTLWGRGKIRIRDVKS